MFIKNFKVKECSTFLSQFRGLIFQPKKNLLFNFKKETKINLHMFFVFYPIDIIFINKEHVVIKKVRAYPFQPFIRGIKCKYILEIPEKNDIKENEKLEFS
jgi:uncharacterized membrane protein (UPF0127 family)